MSLHKSLSSASRGRRHRNVLTREERMAKLEDDGRWDEEKSVYGLPKVRSIKPTTGKKKAKKEAEAAEAAEAGEAAAPAEGEAPAAEKK